ncbi:MAG: agmatinase [Acidobacteria bacterium]|nr:agmatinase [Acidobacteriota bacterium]
MLKRYPAALPFRFGGLEDEQARYETARAVVVPVPLERTTTYARGTRRGPAAILEASRNMELFDEELQVETGATVGIATLEEMDTETGGLENILAHIHTTVLALLEEGKFPVLLGGEHSLTPPAVSAAARKFSDLSVLQIDAHADLRESYQGNPNSHACAMRRVLEVCPAVQVGIRSLSKEEATDIPRLKTRIFWAKDLVGRPAAEWAPEVVAALSPHVYLTIDLDAFDPALMPATGTPEPGGLSWEQVTGLLRLVGRQRKLVALDVVELLPTPGLHAADFLAAKLIYRSLGYVFCQTP